MKRLYGLLIILALASSVGCNKKNDESTGVNGGGRLARTDGAPTTNPVRGNMSLVGRFLDRSEYSFQDNAAGLANGSIPEDYLGRVSNGYNGDNRTGIFFGGEVGFAANAAGGRQEIHPESRLIISIVDDLAAAKKAEPVGIYMSQAQGYVEGNYAEIQFSDDIGVVLLRGNFDNQNFTGEVLYSNDTLYDGSPGGGEGSFSEFRIPTCSFFKCN